MGQHLLDLVESYYFWGYVGFLAGTALSVRNALRNGVSFPAAVLVMTAAIYGGLFGSRLLFLFECDPWLHNTDWKLILVFWEGGLGWLGGPVAGGMACALALLIARQPLWINLGAIIPGISLAHAISRIGCLMTGCCYGRPTSVPWAIYSDTLQARVHPTQIYSMICELATVTLLQVLFRRPSLRKYLYPLYLVLLASQRFIEEFFRGTPAGPELILGLRFYQSVCVLIFAISLCALLVLWRKRLGIFVSCAIAAATVSLFAALRPTALTTPIETRVDREPYLVLTRTMFADALRPWVALRERQGFHIVLRTWDTAPSNEDLSGWIRQNAISGGRYVLLVGDCAPNDEEGPPWHMPTIPLDEKNVSDSRYGDLDGDGLPELAVGRFPARTPDELAGLVAKVNNYESRPLPGRNRQALVWIGAAGFEDVGRVMTSRLGDILPAWLSPRVIGVALAPQRRPAAFLEALAGSPFISVVVSHGSYRDLAAGENERVNVNLAVEDLAKMPGGHASAPMFLLTCYAGSFNMSDERGRSIGEAFCLHPAGPVTVVAATKSTNAVVNYVFARAIASLLAERPAGLDNAGDLFRFAQRRLTGPGTGLNDPNLLQDEMAVQIMSVGELKDGQTPKKPEALTGDVTSYIFLGDPACRLWFP